MTNRAFIFCLRAALVVGLFMGAEPFNSPRPDPEFSQFYANPMLLNPALAGTTQGPYIVLEIAISGPLNEWGICYAIYQLRPVLPFNHGGGVAFNILNDQLGVNTLGQPEFPASYAYHQSISS